MATLLARLPGRSKTEAIEEAIGAFLASEATNRLKSLAGTLDLDDVSAAMRRADRST